MAAQTTHSAAIEDGDSIDNESALPRDKMLAGQSLQAAAASSKIGSRSICEKDRKIGHRRVNEEGETSYKKIQSNQLMQSIQLGIQHSIVALGRYDERDLLMQDFMTVETAPFPRGGTSTTPTHTCSDFTFRTFAPLAFRYFLNLFGIKRQDFMVSLCSQALRELSNPGASGSIFYLTNDDEFILKTIMHKEAEFLQKLLPGYYMNLNQNPHTLLPKFFGMYCYQCNQKNIRIVIMNNLLPSNVRMHLRFDLKGSTYKRKASKHERAKSSPTYKDLDFMEMLPEGLLLEHETYNALISTLRRDCRVLESFRIMDYSLLVGVYNLDQAAKEAAENSSEGSPSKDASGRRLRPAAHKQKLVAHSTAMESIQAQTDPIDEQEHLPPGGIPARNHKGERLLLFLGIIDILQSYQMRKKLEHTFKSIIHDGDTVSVHRPSFYAHRFLGFMGDRVFKKIPSLDLPEFKGAHRKFRTIVSSLIALKHTPSRKSKRESVKKLPSDASEDHHEPNTPPASRRAAAATTTEHSTATHETETPEVNLPAVLWDRPSSGASRNARPLTSAPRSSSHPRSPREVPDSAFGQMGFDGGTTQTAKTAGVQRGAAAFRSQPDVVPASSSVERNSRPRNRLHEQVKYSSSSRHSESSSHASLGASSGWGTETPTWSERTPSYTESSRSHDGTPNKSLIGSGSREDIVTRSYKNSPYHETEI